MKKFISFLLILMILISNLMVVYAQGSATINADKINQEINDEQLVSVNIQNNPGIMGFKLHFEYDTKAVEVLSVQKGEVTKKGSLYDNLGNKTGKFDVLWNHTSEVKTNGSIVVLELKCLTDKPFEIKVSYSQPDTFNGNFEDVVLTCNNIYSSNQSVEDDETTTQSSSNDKRPFIIEWLIEILTRIFRSFDILSLTDVEVEKQHLIVKEANRRVEETFGEENYYADYNAVVTNYKSMLQEQMIEDSDSLATSKSSAQIIKEYKEMNNIQTITTDDVQGLVKVFQNEGLDTVYSDYLSDEELKVTFMKMDGYSVPQDAAETTTNTDKVIAVIAILAGALFVSGGIIIMKRRCRKENEV